MPSQSSDETQPATPAPTPTTPAPPIRKSPFFEATNAARYGRQGLIDEIENKTHIPLICFVVGDEKQITRSDVIGFVDLLHNIPQGSSVDLLLHTPGGDIDATEKIGLLLRKRVGPNGKLRAIIPDFAKSAGTLLALSADQIIMGDTSELGTIDPQVWLPGETGPASYSAKSYLDAFKLHSEGLAKDPNDRVAEIMLSKLDPVMVRKFERMTKRSETIAAELLRRGMIPDEDEANRIAANLIDTQAWHSHGQVISHELAVGIGLAVEHLPAGNVLWELIWALYCRQRIVADKGIKVFESRVVSVPGLD